MNVVIRALGIVAILSASACNVEKTKDAKLPEVEVNASGGQMPEFNVEGPTVNVGTEKKTIEVPTVDVNVPKDHDKKGYRQVENYLTSMKEESDDVA